MLIRRYLALAIFCGCTLCARGEAPATALRLAVVALAPGDVLNGLDAALLARLPRDPEVAFVDRSDIDRALAEQKLVSASLADRAAVAALARTIKADLVLLTDPLPEAANTIGLAIFDARMGRRLWDEAIRAATAEDLADLLFDRAQKALAKNSDPEAVSVSLMPPRNAELPTPYLDLGIALTRVLERRLAHTPRVAVMERAFLEMPAGETATGGPDPASYVIQLELGQGSSPETVRSVAVIMDAGGRILARPEVEGHGPPARLADALWSKVCEALRIAAETAPDRGLEAACFVSEGKRLRDHGFIAEAYGSIMSAWALEPSQAAIREAAFDVLLVRATHAVKHAPRDAILLASRALDVGLDGGLDLSGSARPLRDFVVADKQRMLDADDTGELFGALLERTWRAVSSPDNPAARRSWDCVTLAVCAASAEEYVSRMGADVDSWLAMYQRPDAEWSALLQRMYAMWLKPCATVHPEIAGLVPRDHTLRAGLLSLCEKMESQADPLIQMLGRLGIMIHDAEADALGDAQLVARWDDLLEDVDRYTSALRAGEQTKNVRQRRSEAYWIMLDAADLVSDPVVRFGLAQRVFDLAWDRKDFSMIVGDVATTSALGPWRNINMYVGAGTKLLPDRLHGQIMENCRRAIAAYGDAGIEHPDPWDWQRDVSRYRAKLAQYEAEWLPAPSASPAAVKLLDCASAAGVKEWQAMLVQPGRITLSGRLADGGWQVLEHREGEGAPVARGRLPPGAPPSLVAVDEDVMVVQKDTAPWLLSSGELRQMPLPREPFVGVMSVAALGGKLYLGSDRGADGTRFLCVDRTSGRVETLASSERRDARTPLDNLHPGAYVRRLYADPSRDRLVLVVDRGVDINNYHDYLPLIGLWEYKPVTGQFRPLVECHRNMWTGNPGGDRFLYAPSSGNPWQPGTQYRPWYGVIEFDMATEASRVLCSFKGLPGGPSLLAGEEAVRGDAPYRPPFATQAGLIFCNAESGFRWMKPPDATLHRVPGVEPRQLEAAPGGSLVYALTRDALWRIDVRRLAE